jgi:hypothetical protein
VNQLFENRLLAGEAGLATPLNDNVSLRMRKRIYFRESAVWKLLAGEAELVTPLNDSVPLRMRKMRYSLESAVWKLLPSW